MSKLAMHMLDVFPGDTYRLIGTTRRFYVVEVQHTGDVILGEFLPLYTPATQIRDRELAEHYQREETNWAVRVRYGCTESTNCGEAPR